MTHTTGENFDSGNIPEKRRGSAWREQLQQDVVDLRTPSQKKKPRVRRPRTPQLPIVGEEPSLDGLRPPPREQPPALGNPAAPLAPPAEYLDEYAAALQHHFSQEQQLPRVETASLSEELPSFEELGAELASFDIKDVKLQRRLAKYPRPKAHSPYRNFSDAENASALSDYRLIPEHTEELSSQLGAKRSASKRRKFFFAGVALLFAGALATLAVSIFLVKDEVLADAQTAYGSMQRGRDALLALDAESAQAEFANAEEQFIGIENRLGPVSQGALMVAAHIPLQANLYSAAHLLNAGKLYAHAGYEASTALVVLKGAGPVLPNQPADVALTDIIVEAAGHLDEAHTAMKDANRQLSAVRTQDIPEGFRADIAMAQRQADEIEKLFDQAHSSIDALLTFLGHEQPRTYLFAFQNNSELRPTGGFIGTYGVLELNKGNVENLVVNGIYDPDGQLAVDVVPPRPLQYVTPNWGTRDANWFFDFPTSAEHIISFFEKTGGGTPNGVIAITPPVIEKLLALTGPVDMPDYGVTLTTDNFLELVQQEVEQGYDKTENKPKQILADLTPILIERVGALDSNAELLNLLRDSLSRKDIQIYSRDTNVSSFVRSHNWGGQVVPPTYFGASIGDYLAVVASNIGGWKTDRYTDTAVDSVTQIEADGTILRTVTLSRRHTGGKTPYSWYNKPNIGYIKVYAPAGASLVSAEGFSAEPPLIQTDYEGLGYVRDGLLASIEEGMTTDEESGTDVFSESGLQVFGNWLSVKPGEQKIASITYKLPQRLYVAGGNYELLIQKQSGLDAEYSGSVELASDAPFALHCDVPPERLGGAQFKLVQTADVSVSCTVGSDS